MTMRGAHYTCPNDTVMTNKWHSATAVTNLCPTITYLAPAAITNYISQTRRPEVRKPGSLSPKKGCFLFHNSDFCSRKLTLISHGFSQLWSGEGTGECQRFSTFGLIFICHSSSPLSSDGKRNWSLWHIRSPAPLEQVFLAVIFRKEGEIDLFDIFLGAPQPRDIALSAIVNVHFNFGSVDIQSFCLGDSAQIRPALILLFAYSNVSLLFKFPVCYFQIF